MRGRSSSKQEGNLQIDKIKQEPQLSGAYIRSLVKQLTSSRTKDPLNPKNHDTTAMDGNGLSVEQNSANIGDGFSERKQPQPPQQPPQHKKQVRRRLHTSRPYQERLLNMAEARREIVTALKFHRAAMKQANEQQRQTQTELQPLQPSAQLVAEQGKLKSRRNPRTDASNSNNFSSHLGNFTNSAFYYPQHNPYSWPMQFAAPPISPENLNFPLPNQPLGLNLNFHDFSNLDASPYCSINNPSTYASSASSSSTTSSPPTSMAFEEVPSVALSQEGPQMVVDVMDSSLISGVELGFHPAMDDKEMAEIRSIGEQHQMEWNDTLNLVTSAWWFKFLKAMEIGPEEKVEDFGCCPFDEVMEFPSWLNANEGCLQEQFNGYLSDYYLQDSSLPCMDIEEIEGLDGEWLS